MCSRCSRHTTKLAGLPLAAIFHAVTDNKLPSRLPSFPTLRHGLALAAARHSTRAVSLPVHTSQEPVEFAYPNRQSRRPPCAPGAAAVPLVWQAHGQRGGAPKSWIRPWLPIGRSSISPEMKMTFLHYPQCSRARHAPAHLSPPSPGRILQEDPDAPSLAAPIQQHSGDVGLL